jgi:hypothetical protein
MESCELVEVVESGRGGLDCVDDNGWRAIEVVEDCEWGVDFVGGGGVGAEVVDGGV